LNAGLQEVPESENKYKNSNEMCIMDEVPEKQAILKAITKYWQNNIAATAKPLEETFTDFTREVILVRAAARHLN
jgi:hypothetical protein